MDTSALYFPLRTALFRLSPETAHRVALGSLDRLAALGLLPCLLPPPDAGTGSGCRMMGLDFPNRVGLAAGLDKDGEHIDALAALGFGFLELGTVTPRPQPGNPQPRLFRLPRAEALINRMGFNNQGVDALVARVAQSRYAQQGGIVGINIGKNADTPLECAGDDYCLGLARVYPHASYVTVNISSPNTTNLRTLQAEEALAPLLERLKETQALLAQQHGRRVPLALKIAPDLTAEALDAIAELLLHYRFDAVIATNSTVSREGVAHLPHATEGGGLSGLPLRARASASVRQLATRLAGQIPVIGVGGILSGADAQEKISAGAQLVQLYTGFIYRGWGLVDECVRTLANIRVEETSGT